MCHNHWQKHAKEAVYRSIGLNGPQLLWVKVKRTAEKCTNVTIGQMGFRKMNDNIAETLL